MHKIDAEVMFDVGSRMMIIAWIFRKISQFGLYILEWW